MSQNAAAMSATCSYASAFAPKETELHVVHGAKYVPYIDDDARLDHIDFVELAVEAIERMLDTNSIDTYIKQHGNAASIRIDVDGQGQKTRTASSDSCPDVVFDHVDLVHVIGEAKATLKDLQSAHAAIRRVPASLSYPQRAVSVRRHGEEDCRQLPQQGHAGSERR